MDEIKRIVLDTAPRILGFMDRTPTSSTFGCGDRYYWQYKLHDVANARFQEACLFLTLLYMNNFAGNIYYRNKKILDWIIASTKFWCSNNKNGFVSEVYPHERSFCATAFSSFAITETILQLQGADSYPKTIMTQFLQDRETPIKLEKTGLWISKNLTTEAANQMAAAMLSLYNIFLITNNQEYKNAATTCFSFLKKDYDRFGYPLEYGGLDIGYLSISNSCLSWYYDKTDDNKEAVMRMIGSQNLLIEKQLDAFGNYSNKATSRHTQFLYPYGFLKGKSTAIKNILNGLASNKIVNPLWMDDRYCIALATDYLKTYIGTKT